MVFSVRLIALAITFTMFAIAPELNLTDSQVALVISIPWVLALFLSFGAGLVGLKIGLKASVGIAGLMVSLAGLLTCFADNYALILASRVLLGIGYNLILPNVTSMVGVWFSIEERPTAIGVFTTSVQASDVFNALATVPLLQFLKSWRYTFLLYTVIVMVFTFLWRALAKMPSKLSANRGLGYPTSSSPLKASVHAVVKCKDVLFLCLANLFDGVSAWGIMTLIPIINQVLKELGPQEASIIAFPLYFGAMVGMLSYASISNIFKSRKLMFIFRAIVTALLTYLITIIPAKYIPLYMVYMFTLGMVLGWFPALNGTYIMELPEVGPTLSPVALGLTNMFGIGIGGFLGPLLMGYVSSMTNLIIIYSVVMAGSTIFYIPLKETYRK